MICANKNNPLFQELSKNVPSGFITKLLTENPEIKPEKIYSRYIAKLQQLDKGQVELPNVIPLKGNEQLYKDYNLLAKDGKVKVIKEKEASSWLEKLNRSPYYSFAYRKTGLKEGRIFILPKQEPVEETKPGKPEQLTLFAPSEVNYGLKSVEILSSDKAKQIFSKGEKSGWDLNKILTELQIPKPQKEIIIGLGKTKLDDIITNLLANYSYTIEINTAKIKDISQFNQQ